MKLSVFCGTFNPFTQSHEGLIKQTFEETDIDQIIIAPNSSSPFKPNTMPVHHRINMIKLVTRNTPNTKVIHTHHEPEQFNLTASMNDAIIRFPNAELSYLCGADAFVSRLTPEIISSIENIREYGQPIISTRAGVCTAELYKAIDNYIKLTNIDPILLDAKYEMQSSTFVRENIANTSLVKDKINPDVHKYITDNGLYLQK